MRPLKPFAVVISVGLLAACGDAETSSDATPDATADVGPEVDPDPCASQPCRNGGTCTATGAGFSCVCAAGWTGSSCETSAGCDGAPCGVGACTDDGAGGYSCDCPAGAFDDGASCAACTELTGCDALTCTSSKDSVCSSCASGFEPDGDACVDIDDCASAPCGDGTCTDMGANAYECACTAGFYDDGSTCAACGAVPDCAEVSCNSASDAVCEVCDDGYVIDGDGCSPAGDGPCAGDPCGDGTCADNGDDTYTCTCDDGFYDDGATCAACAALDGCASPTCTSADDSACAQCAEGWVEDGVGGCQSGVVDCGQVSPMGTCNGSDEVQWCIVPPAGIIINLQANSACLAGEQCRQIDGVSRCYPEVSATECTRPMAWCDGDVLAACTEAGPMTRTDCDEGCVSRQQGAYCASATPSKLFESRFTYEYRLPNDDLSDWESEPRTANLRGAVVQSYRKVADGYEVFDSAVTDNEGRFAIRVVDPPSPDDVVTVYAARNRPLSDAWSFAIAEPDVPDGQQPSDDPGNGSPYRWDISPATAASGETVLVTEALGAGALRVFDVMSVVYENTAELYYRELEPQSVVVWLRLGTTWSCGECHWSSPTNALGPTMDTQMYISGDTGDAEYWADAVTLHEAGHWVMGAFGLSPGEGGPHNFGVAYYPGLAWSEGFATWLSSDWRDNSRYLDKQGGSVFWLDIASRSGPGDSPWPRPVPEDGLTGRIYENEVSAMLWRLSTNPEVTANELYGALNAPRAKLALRGYTRHVWVLDSETSEPINVEDLGEPAVMLADFLDALVCGTEVADIADHVDAATEPQDHYAYPSASPICE